VTSRADVVLDLKANDETKRPLRRAESRIQRLGKNARKSFARVGSAAKVATKAVAGIGIAAVGIGSSLVASVVETAKEYDRVSKIIGVSRETLQGWVLAANDAEVNADTFRDALVELQQRIWDANDGSEAQIALFKDLGVSWGLLATLSPEDQLRTLIDAFSRIEDPIERARIANELFGEVGQQLVPILSMGAQAFDELVLAQQDYIITEETAAKLAQLGKSWNRFITRIKVYVADGIVAARELWETYFPIVLAALQPGWKRFQAWWNQDFSGWWIQEWISNREPPAEFVEWWNAVAVPRIQYGNKILEEAFENFAAVLRTVTWNNQIVFQDMEQVMTWVMTNLHKGILVAIEGILDGFVWFSKGVLLTSEAVSAAWNWLSLDLQGQTSLLSSVLTTEWRSTLSQLIADTQSFVQRMLQALQPLLQRILRVEQGTASLLSQTLRSPALPNVPSLPAVPESRGPSRRVDFGDLPALQHGGVVSRTGLAVVHEGETYIPREYRGRGGSRPINVTINVRGSLLQQRDFNRDVRRAITEGLRAGSVVA